MLSGKHFSAFYKASDFCWQTILDFPQHLRMTHIYYRYHEMVLWTFRSKRSIQLPNVPKTDLDAQKKLKPVSFTSTLYTNFDLVVKKLGLLSLTKIFFLHQSLPVLVGIRHVRKIILKRESFTIVCDVLDW